MKNTYFNILANWNMILNTYFNILANWNMILNTYFNILANWNMILSISSKMEKANFKVKICFVFVASKKSIRYHII